MESKDLNYSSGLPRPVLSCLVTSPARTDPQCSQRVCVHSGGAVLSGLVYLNLFDQKFCWYVSPPPSASVA